MNTYHSIRAWSLLTDLPVLCYVKLIDEYIVFWDGYLMSMQSALAVALEPYGIYHGASVYDKIHSDFAKIFAAGGFGKQHWPQDLVKNVLPYHRKIRLDLKEKYKASEVFARFNLSSAIVLEEVNNESN